MTDSKPKCLVCARTNEEVPLLALGYRDQQYYICPQHLPNLIHNPQELVGLLPGAENLTGHAHD